MTRLRRARATAPATGGMSRRHLLAGTSRLGLLATLGSLCVLGACTAAQAQDEPWLDGSLWSDGTGWRP
ncbi:MAG: hypothetical protein ACREH3_17205 [Geminicoccales bacterium]